MLKPPSKARQQKATELAETAKPPAAGKPAAELAIADMPFEVAMAELERIVDTLEKGQVPLEDSITLYERGELLKQRCDALLKNAEMRVQKIIVGEDGKAKGLTPLDPL